MKLYRNHYSTEGGCSQGFTFHGSKAEAKRFVKQLDPESETPLRVAEPIIIETTKRGLIRALNLLAGHPDNG